MAVFKCKMCGGQLEVQENQTVIECEYCGTQQTLPTLDNEKKLNLFNRANRLRMSNEFDKAAGVFESIVAEFPEEAEAYWGLVLCKYGIEYVDDPTTGKKVPTCHRTSYDSIFDDNNFEMALEYADGVATSVYRSEAKEIDRLQKAILDIASKEEPFDVFICYKETAEDGQRTKDSVMAEDIYDRLTDKGYKVFFARITLEDKLGQEYEPFIFSALNSAKVMLAIGTKYEYYNAVWVKNEWSRFLEMMKKDKNKLLIPCYADIDAYDMPSEFRNLQGQDMNKIGFIQDLIRGIGKVIPLKKEEKVVTQAVVTNSAEAPLLKRAYMFLEDGKWNEAKDYFNKVLDINPECGDAYAGLFLVEKNMKSISGLISSRKNYANNAKYENYSKNKDEKHIADKVNKYVIPNYLEKEEIINLYDFSLGYSGKTKVLTRCLNNEKQFWTHDYYTKVERFNNGEQASSLINAKKEIIEHITNKIKDAKHEEEEKCLVLEKNYKEFLVLTDEKLVNLYNERKAKKTEDERIAAEKLLAENTATYNEAIELAKTENLQDIKSAIEVLNSIVEFKDAKKKIAEFNVLYDTVTTYNNAMRLFNSRTVDKVKEARELFLSISSFRDSNEMAKRCVSLINEIKAKNKKSKTLIIVFVVVAILAGVGFVVGTSILNKNTYAEANSLLNNKQYVEALELFDNISKYEDSSSKIVDILPLAIDEMVQQSQFDQALECMELYATYIEDQNTVNGLYYQIAISQQQNGLFDDAIEVFTKLENYKDSSLQAVESCYLKIVSLFEKEDYVGIVTYKEKVNNVLSVEYKDLAYYYGVAFTHEKGDSFGGLYFTAYAKNHSDGKFFNEVQSIIKTKKKQISEDLRSALNKKEYFDFFKEGGNYFDKMTEADVKKVMKGSWKVYYDYFNEYTTRKFTLSSNGKGKEGSNDIKWSTSIDARSAVHLEISFADVAENFVDFTYVDQNTIQAYTTMGDYAYFIRQ